MPALTPPPCLKRASSFGATKLQASACRAHRTGADRPWLAATRGISQRAGALDPGVKAASSRDAGPAGSLNSMPKRRSSRSPGHWHGTQDSDDVVSETLLHQPPQCRPHPRNPLGSSTRRTAMSGRSDSRSVAGFRGRHGMRRCSSLNRTTPGRAQRPSIKSRWARSHDIVRCGSARRIAESLLAQRTGSVARSVLEPACCPLIVAPATLSDAAG